MSPRRVSAYRAAVAQVSSVTEVGANVAQVIRTCHEAARRGAKLVVFPECGLTGYQHSSLEEVREVALVADGPELGRLAGEAEQLGLVLVVGHLERVPGRQEVYNTATLLGPKGARGNYRKVHLPYLAADRFVTPGDQGPVVVDTELGRIGLSICYDLCFPEWGRGLALAGAELVANPTNWTDAARQWAMVLPPARAFENGTYVLVANRGDTEKGADYIGLSVIASPTGDVVDRAERGCQLLVSDIDRALVRPTRFAGTAGERPYLAGRRPELYRELLDLQH